MSTSPSATSQGTILLVDDTTANLQLLMSILTEQGYSVHPASDGQLALRFVESILPDIILLDVQMPGMDGYEVCRRLKANKRTEKIPIIFISILEGEREKVRAFQEGGVDYISKPFYPEEVLARVKNHLRLRELTERLEQKVRERTDELTTTNQRLQQEVAERSRAQEDLRKLNETLEQRVRDELALNRDKDHLLIQQSRLAAMGEMVHNIAHQWRQPLNSIAIILGLIQDEYEFHELTKDSLDNSIAEAQGILKQMSTTIDDFRSFFRPDREPELFDVSKSVSRALSILEATMKNSNIQIDPILEEGLMVFGYSSQFAQVVLNILTNAREAIQSRKIEPGKIEMRLSRSEQMAVITIKDNGGGIPEEVIDRIFEPYFTTRERGSGIGLYMSRMIIERNLGGQIRANNDPAGAVITLSLPLAVR